MVYLNILFHRNICIRFLENGIIQKLHCNNNIQNTISDSDQKRNIPGLHPRIRYQCNEFLTINHILYIQKWAIHYACVRIHSNKYEKDKKKGKFLLCYFSEYLNNIYFWETWRISWNLIERIVSEFPFCCKMKVSLMGLNGR